jgi:hypothetical protein
VTPKNKKYVLTDYTAIRYYNKLIEGIKSGNIKYDDLPNYGMDFHWKISSVSKRNIGKHLIV